MQYRTLGNTDIKVSAICLGTMTWGEQNTQKEAFAQLDYALAQGVNFIDTAELYPVPPKAETYARTESIIGNWISQRQNRDKIVLASKVASRSDWLPHIRDGQAVLDYANIKTALENSLKRLQTDYIDLYQLHWPDRSTNFFGQLGYRHNAGENSVPILETLQALNEFMQQGKIRTIGVSNETPWGVMEYLQLAEKHDLPRIVSVQNPYNLLNRTYEIGLAEISIQEQAGLLAYSPLGFGVLSGKYLGNQYPAGARLSLFSRFDRYTNPRGIEATQSYVNITKKHGLDPAQMALAYVNGRDFLTSNIIGATNMEQLRSNIDSINLTLSDEILAEIEQVHENNPNPCP